jgi:lipopolysaccharide export LptBFGC system permease protein LptF
MAKYRKKPLTMEVEHYTGDTASVMNINKFVGKELDGNGRDLFIETLEGVMAISPGDWVIKGVKGEFYPCKPDIFDMTYEKVE